MPVLDGGHITLSLIEAARRRPVSPKVLNYIQSGFAAVLIGFMLWIAFFDTGDWIRSSRPIVTSTSFSLPRNSSPCATANRPTSSRAARPARSSSAILPTVA
ncbi:MAG: hypothetical protein U1F83_13290 [Verrucomicrobiota bacterium]